jgi:hypothetical protein
MVEAVAVLVAAHARTRATHKAASSVWAASPHKLVTRMLNSHVSSKHGPTMTKMPSPPATCRPAFRHQANRPAATVVVFVAVALPVVVVVVAAVAVAADHAPVVVVAAVAVAVQAAAATPALSTAVKPRHRPHMLVRPGNIGLLTRFGFAGLFHASVRLSP